MRLLVVSNLYPPHHLGGYEVACHSFVEHARGAGDEVRVLTSGYRTTTGRDVDEPHVDRVLRWYRDERLGFATPGPLARLALERANHRVLRRELACFRPDCVSWWGMGAMSLSLVAAVRRAGVPATGMVADEWMLWAGDVDAWTRGWARHPRLGRVAERLTGIPASVDLDRAAHWVFTSHWLLDRVRAAGREPVAAAVQGLGVDPDPHGDRPRPPWRFHVVCPGRITRNKGTDVAVAALEHLPPETTLELAGSSAGDERFVAEVVALASNVGAGGRVSAGMVERERMGELYARADVVVFPVRWEEPWGLVPLEAMAAGVPVVATGTGGSAEYLRDGENALLVPRDDPRALAAAVRRLADDGLLRERLCDGGRETAARFSSATVNEALRCVATEAVAAAGARRQTA